MDLGLEALEISARFLKLGVQTRDPCNCVSGIIVIIDHALTDLGNVRVWQRDSFHHGCVGPCYASNMS